MDVIELYEVSHYEVAGVEVVELNELPSSEE